MTSLEQKVVLAALLHDMGKVSVEGGTSKEKTLSFLDKVGHFLEEKDCFSLEEEPMALGHLVSFSKKVASMVDDRGSENMDRKSYTLYSIFNLLNENNQEFHYGKVSLGSDEIPYPISEDVPYAASHYEKALENIEKTLKNYEDSGVFLMNLLNALEENLSFLPSQTITNEIADISLYDHLKITSAVASCVYQYSQEKEISQYLEEFGNKEEQYFQEDLFLLCSMDISGIQSFIYTIATSKALKNLRSRSFYLELVMEHMVDELLKRLSLCRSNLLYCGGGHAYLLLPNTESAKEMLESFRLETNQWFLDEFSTALFLAVGAVPCSADDLQNKEEGAYVELFKSLSNLLSLQKSARYSEENLLFLNFSEAEGTERECMVCQGVHSLNAENKCAICFGLECFSTDIQEKSCFVVTKTKGTLPLPFGYWLHAEEDVVATEMDGFVRAYSKTARPHTNLIHVGDYQHPDCKTLEELANLSQGVKKLAVLRGDIDNLGQAFTSGFQRKEQEEYVISLSRTATLSRKLSVFFKSHINTILSHSDFSFTGKEKGQARAVSIVYSGGDDVFFIGAWDEVIGAAVDLQVALEKFTQGTLTLSAGLGFYSSSYPLKIMARETGELEESSKNYQHPQYGMKNAITLFDEEHCYGWQEFKEEVMGQKYRVISEFFQSSTEYGSSFLYNMLDFMRNTKDKINLARFAYLLARLEPQKGGGSPEEFRVRQERYQEFSGKMYQWLRDENHKRQAITALYLYVYRHREKEKES